MHSLLLRPRSQQAIPAAILCGHMPPVLGKDQSLEVTHLPLLSCNQHGETAFMVKVFSFAQIQFMDGKLQMHLILNRGSEIPALVPGRSS